MIPVFIVICQPRRSDYRIFGFERNLCRLIAGRYRQLPDLQKCRAHY